MRILRAVAVRAVGLSWAIAFVVSCGGAQAPAETAAAPQSSAAAPPSGVAWKDMNHAQRLDYMKRSVLPKMKDQFALFDAKRFGEMNCMTCHGDSAKDGSFKMPNPKLPKLPADEAGFKKLTEKMPEAAKFMGTKVVPTMASLLGEQPFNPSTRQGFGCFECHTK